VFVYYWLAVAQGASPHSPNSLSAQGPSLKRDRQIVVFVYYWLAVFVYYWLAVAQDASPHSPNSLSAQGPSLASDVLQPAEKPNLSFFSMVWLSQTSKWSVWAALFMATDTGMLRVVASLQMCLAQFSLLRSASSATTFNFCANNKS